MTHHPENQNAKFLALVQQLTWRTSLFSIEWVLHLPGVLPRQTKVGIATVLVVVLGYSLELGNGYLLKYFLFKNILE